MFDADLEILADEGKQSLCWDSEKILRALVDRNTDQSLGWDETGCFSGWKEGRDQSLDQD